MKAAGSVTGWQVQDILGQDKRYKPWVRSRHKRHREQTLGHGENLKEGLSILPAAYIRWRLIAGSVRYRKIPKLK